MKKKPLPNLFIIGAAKSGTTTLNSILNAHPEVYMSPKKAPRFFSKDDLYLKGLSWYASRYFSGSGKYPVRGEATPSYLALANFTAPRIKKTMVGKNIKFIVIFRDPTERAYSHYWFNMSKIRGAEDRESFQIAFQKDLNNFLNNFKPKKSTSTTLNYYQNGQYSRWVKEYLKYFKIDQFLFLLTEDLYSERYQNTLKNIFKFLEIAYFPIEYKHEKKARKFVDTGGYKWIIKNRKTISKLIKIFPFFIRNKFWKKIKALTTEPGKYPEINNEVKKEFTKIYLEEINELEKIINRDLSHWKM